MLNMLMQIMEIAEALCEPHTHTERIRDWDGNRNAKYRTHTTTQPGLITQLEQSIAKTVSTGEGSMGGAYGSRPPLALEALSRHLSITVAVMDWCAHLGIVVRATVESNIRALVGAAATLDPDDTRALLADLRRWRGWCAVLTDWEKTHVPHRVPCPVVDCGQPGTLRINLTTKNAMCKACGSTWTEQDGSLGILAEHITAATNAA